jgi:hypothetical protein
MSLLKTVFAAWTAGPSATTRAMQATISAGEGLWILIVTRASLIGEGPQESI